MPLARPKAKVETARRHGKQPQQFFDEYWGGRVWADEVDLNDLYEPAFVSTVV